MAITTNPTINGGGTGGDATSIGVNSIPGSQTVVALGDSLQARGFNLNAAPRYEQNTPLNWGCALLKQALWVPFGCSTSYVSGDADIVNYCVAVSGQTTVDVINTQLSKALALSSGWWSVQAGTNDLTLLAADSVETITGRLQTICQRGLKAGSKIILWTIPPRATTGGSGNWTDSNAIIVGAGSTITIQRQKQMAINQWIRQYASTTPGVVLMDSYDLLVDVNSATGDPISSYFDDGVHWNNAGAFVVGTHFANVMSKYVQPLSFSTISQSDTYSTVNSTGNLIPLSGLLGTGGTVGGTGISGTPPTGWNTNLQSGTLTPGTCAVVTQNRTAILGNNILQNGREIQHTVAGTAPGAFQIRSYSSTSSTVPANTPFYVEVEVEVTANAAAWVGPALQVFFNTGAVSSFVFEPGSAALPVGSTFSAVLRSPLMKHTGTANGLAFIKFAGIASSAFTVKVVRVSGRTLTTYE